MILGIDEVGRGPWAGPLVVGAVVLGDTKIDGLTDSKKLSKKKLKEFNQIILEQSSSIGLGWVHSDELDEIGMSASLVEATKRAVSEICVPYHEIIIDGTINFLASTSKGQYVTTLKKADLLINAVSAASIVAKVARDTYMEQQHELYPMYGFDSHVGYGTAKHRAMIDKHGITRLHRLSFAPLAKYRTGIDSKAVSLKKVTSKQTGDDAEDIAAKYLSSMKYEIIERNWKTKLCEIDIVASKDNILYFVEVKYRKNLDQGGGIAAVTPKKIRQMKFSVEVYTKYKSISNQDMRLAVITVSGKPPIVESYLLVE
jgi:ribonuclease HII